VSIIPFHGRVFNEKKDAKTGRKTEHKDKETKGVFIDSNLFRTPKATFCAKCGLKKVEAEQTSERYGSKPAAR
jgi:hypothetical protein